jgi:hypothetical protein
MAKSLTCIRSWRCRQYIPSKHLYLPTRPLGVPTQIYIDSDINISVVTQSNTVPAKQGPSWGADSHLAGGDTSREISGSHGSEYEVDSFLGQSRVFSL